MRARRFVVLVVVVGTASCLSFGDLTGGETDASVDATAITGDAAIADSPSPLEAGPQGDFCASVDATFCEDFDRPGTFGSFGWTTFNGDGLSTVAIAEGGVSPPSCLRSDVPPADASAPDEIASELRHTLVGTFSHVVFQFDFSIDNADTLLSLAYFGGLDIATADSITELRFGLKSSGNYFVSDIQTPDAGKVFNTVSPQIAFTNGAWHHAEVDFDVSTAPGTAKATLDGKVVQNGAVTGAVYGPGTVTVGAGFVYAQTPCGEWTMRTDNVVVYAN